MVTPAWTGWGLLKAEKRASSDSPLVHQADGFKEHIAVNGEALRTDLVEGVLRGVVIAVVGSVVQIDDIHRRHAALHKGQMIVFDLFLFLEEVVVVTKLVRSLLD